LGSIARCSKIHVSKLGDFGHVGVIGFLRILALNVDDVAESPCTDELFPGLSHVLEAFFREVGHFSGNGLKASVHLAERTGCRFKTILDSSLIVLSNFLDLFLNLLPRSPDLISHPLGFLHYDLLSTLLLES